MKKLKNVVKRVMMFMLAAVITTGTAVVATEVAMEPVQVHAGGKDASLESQIMGSGKGAKDNGGALDGVLDIILTVARFAGIVLGAWGAVKLIMAFKDQDANGITSAIILIVVGVALTLIKTFVGSIFNLGTTT